MATLTPVSEHFEDANEQITNITMIKNQRFGYCASFNGADVSCDIGTALQVHLNTEAFTSNIWVKINNVTDTLTFIEGKGWEISDGKIKLCEDSSQPNNVSLTPETWHYISWVKGVSHQELYLDGHLVSHCNTATIFEDNLSVIFKAGVAGIQLAHLHNYSRELSFSEMLVNKIMHNASAAQTFNEYYPLDFNIVNTEHGQLTGYPDNRIFITGGVDGHPDIVEQLLKITNVTSKTIQLDQKTNATSADHHFELRLRNATFCQPDTYPQLTSNTPDDWVIERATQQNVDDGSWSIYISYQGDTPLMLETSESIELNYHYRSVDGSLGERGVQQLLMYKDLHYADADLGVDPNAGNIEGERNKRLDVLALPCSVVYPLCASYDAPQGVVCNKSGTDLDVYIYNRSDKPVIFSSRAAIKVKVPQGSSACDFLSNGDSGTLTAEASSPGTIVDRQDVVDTAIFEWKPATGEKIDANSFIKLTLNGCTVNGVAGVAFINVEVRGVDANGDTTLSLAVSKADAQMTVPSGAIVMWQGTGALPEGWQICQNTSEMPSGGTIQYIIKQ